MSVPVAAAAAVAHADGRGLCRKHDQVKIRCVMIARCGKKTTQAGAGSSLLQGSLPTTLLIHMGSGGSCVLLHRLRRASSCFQVLHFDEQTHRHSRMAKCLRLGSSCSCCSRSGRGPSFRMLNERNVRRLSGNSAELVGMSSCITAQLCQDYNLEIGIARQISSLITDVAK